MLAALGKGQAGFGVKYVLEEAFCFDRVILDLTCFAED